MKKLEALKIILQNPFSVLKKGILANYEEMHRRALLKTHHSEQIQTINLLDLLPNFEENIHSYTFLTGASTVVDIALLKGLARRFKACSYLEIGSWRGESLANVAEIAEKCTVVTLSAEQMQAMGFSERVIEQHDFFTKNLKNVIMHYADSHTFDFQSLKDTFDLIFIDGDHSYEGVLNDSKKVFSLRKNGNSIIVWHDYGFYTEDVRHSVLHGILDGIPKDKHKNLYHISNTMCAIYIENLDIPKQFIQKFGPVENIFEVQLKAKKLKV